MKKQIRFLLVVSLIPAVILAVAAVKTVAQQPVGTACNNGVTGWSCYSIASTTDPVYLKCQGVACAADNSIVCTSDSGNYDSSATKTVQLQTSIPYCVSTSPTITGGCAGEWTACAQQFAYKDYCISGCSTEVAYTTTQCEPGPDGTGAYYGTQCTTAAP